MPNDNSNNLGKNFFDCNDQSDVDSLIDKILADNADSIIKYNLKKTDIKLTIEFLCKSMKEKQLTDEFEKTVYSTLGLEYPK